MHKQYVYIICEHTVTNDESENSVSFVFTTVRPNTGITIVSSNNNNKNEMVKKNYAKCVKLIKGCDVLPQEGANPKDNDPMILLPLPDLQKISWKDRKPKYLSQS